MAKVYKVESGNDETKRSIVEGLELIATFLITFCVYTQCN